MTLGLLVAMAAAAPASNWTCAPFNCTCKGMGEYYGILAGVGFGCAPRPAESWWAEQKCPVSSSCSGGQTCCCKGAGCPAPAAHGGRGCAATAPCRACTCQPLPPPPLPPCAHDIPPAPTHPNWTSTYQLNRSTVVYACNYSGFFDSQFLSSFAVVGLDWSNVKAEWAAARPMDDDVRLTTQMAMIKKVDPTVKVTGYRNSIQAYNWMSIVREKMDDPACESPTCPPPTPMPSLPLSPLAPTADSPPAAGLRASADAGWFLKYSDGINGSGYAQSPCAGPKENTTKCSEFWHQLLDEPVCPGGVCDCGAAPCAMYSFDHRTSNCSI